VNGSIDCVVSEHLDTSEFHRLRRTGGVGRAGYHPDMLLTLVLWAWMRKTRSSREIERACWDVVSFRVVCAGDVPDHTTISRFLAANHAACEQLFTEVLVLCHRLGMVKLDTIALDGVKIASNASKDANRTEEGLRKAAASEEAKTEAAREAAEAAAAEAVAEHLAADARDEKLWDEGDDGHDVPDDLLERSSRAARIAEALADLEAEKAAARAAREAKANKYDETVAAGDVPTGVPPADRRVEAARTHLARTLEHQRQKVARVEARRAAAAAAGKRLGGKPVTPADESARVLAAVARLERAVATHHETTARPAKTPTEPVRNITDPQSRLQPIRGGGWIQGYNCQAFTSAEGIIIATGVSNNPADTTAFTPLVEKACATAVKLAGIDTTTDTTTEARNELDVREQAAQLIGLMLFDAGYLSADNLHSPGPDRLIAVGKHRHLEATATTNPADGPPPPDTDPIQAMTHRLRTPEGIAAYRQRSPIAETPFGHAKHNLGFRRFRSRGLNRATSEWSFHAATHNLGKILTRLTTTNQTLPAT
jgi:transposase